MCDNLKTEMYDYITHSPYINGVVNCCRLRDDVMRIIKKYEKPKTTQWTKDCICVNCGCKCYPMDIDFGDYNYCPNCGYRIIESQESLVN